MQKFTSFSKHSRFQKYAVNPPNKKHQKSQPFLRQSLVSHTRRESIEEQQPKKNRYDVIRSQCQSSIRSSMERVKTGKLDRKEIENRQLTRKTIKKVKRYNSEPRQTISQREIINLKRHVNNLNVTCNHIAKGDQPYRKLRASQQAQCRKIMMGQTLFTQIDEEKFVAQKNIIEKFQHLAKSIPQVVQAEMAQAGREQETHIMQCLRLIDRIYAVTDRMEASGYLQKGGRFLSDYCTRGRVWLKQIFLQEVGKAPDSFSLAVRYSAVSSAEKAKRRFSQFIVTNRQESLETIKIQIQALYQHLQHCFTNKLLAGFSNLAFQAGLQYGKNPPLRFSQSGQVHLRLTKDLEKLQQAYGPMREISKVSRRKYEELNRTYDRLQTYF